MTRSNTCPHRFHHGGAASVSFEMESLSGDEQYSDTESKSDDSEVSYYRDSSSPLTSHLTIPKAFK